MLCFDNVVTAERDDMVKARARLAYTVRPDVKSVNVKKRGFTEVNTRILEEKKFQIRPNGGKFNI